MPKVSHHVLAGDALLPCASRTKKAFYKISPKKQARPLTVLNIPLPHHGK